MSSYHEEVIRKIQQEGGDSDRARRRHYVKMGIAGGATLLCFVLFGTGILGQGRTDRTKVQAASKEEAAVAMARVSGPELGALLVGGAAGIWLLVLTLRLHRLE